MLKWFRLYSKQFLVAGTAMLMLAFLVEPAVNLIRRSEIEQVVGTIQGRKVTLQARRHASGELELLKHVSPLLASMAVRDAEQWMLMLEEAREMGIEVSDHEVDELLKLLGLEQWGKQVQVTQAVHAEPPLLRDALRDWLIVQQYREMVYGLGRLSMDERLGNVYRANLFAQQGMFPYAVASYEAAMGRLRVSQPVLQRFVYDQRTTASVQMVEVRADRELDQTPTPEAAKLQELFDQHKGSFPGQSQPFGFGYKFPDRVKLEYLTIPFDRVLEQIRLPEAELFEHYQRNKASYTEAAPAAAPGTPAAPGRQLSYDEVRSRIESDLRRQRAEELVTRITKAAIALLQDNARVVASTSDGYRDVAAAIKDKWQPLSLREVADKVSSQFGVLADYHFDDTRWFDRDTLRKLAGIGTSTLPGNRGATFDAYVMSVRELKPKADQPLVSQRLQVMLPSAVLVNPMTNARYLFRVTEAEPAREPRSLDEVRPQVEKDARLKAAYEKLLADKDRWATLAAEGDLKKLAEQAGSVVAKPEAFPRRDATPEGHLAAPSVGSAGRNEALVDRVFEMVRLAQAAGGVDKLPASQRIAVVPVESRQSLYVIRLEQFEAMPQSEFAGAAQSPQLPSWILREMLRDQTAADPLSLEQLATRLNFKRPDGSTPKAENQPQ